MSLLRFENSKWENAIHKFNHSFNEVINNLPILKDKTDSYKKILNYIHSRGGATKKEILDYMGWGVRIGFNGYRNKLRTEPTIRFTKNRYEVIK
jgi:cobalamin biosynthesis Co2+ chelatase CbiK